MTAPDGHIYRYRSPLGGVHESLSDGYHNGSPPFEVVPYWLAAPQGDPAPAEREALRHFRRTFDNIRETWRQELGGDAFGFADVDSALRTMEMTALHRDPAPPAAASSEAWQPHEKGDPNYGRVCLRCGAAVRSKWEHQCTAPKPEPDAGTKGDRCKVMIPECDPLRAGAFGDFSAITQERCDNPRPCPEPDAGTKADETAAAALERAGLTGFRTIVEGIDFLARHRDSHCADANRLAGRVRELRERAEAAERELQERRDQVDDLQQSIDEITVACGSLGLMRSELPAFVRDLRAKLAAAEQRADVLTVERDKAMLSRQCREFTKGGEEAVLRAKLAAAEARAAVAESEAVQAVIDMAESDAKLEGMEMGMEHRIEALEARVAALEKPQQWGEPQAFNLVPPDLYAAAEHAANELTTHDPGLHDTAAFVRLLVAQRVERLPSIQSKDTFRPTLWNATQPPDRGHTT